LRQREAKLATMQAASILFSGRPLDSWALVLNGWPKVIGCVNLPLIAFLSCLDQSGIKYRNVGQCAVLDLKLLERTESVISRMKVFDIE
jgi:hypothetical protein